MIEIERVGSFDIADDIPGAARVLKKLNQCYPGHVWRVLWDEDGGMCRINCLTVQHPLFTNMLYCYDLKLKRFDTDPDMKCVMRAGGEILERANLDRHRFQEGVFPTFIEGVAAKHQPRISMN